MLHAHDTSPDPTCNAPSYDGEAIDPSGVIAAAETSYELSWQLPSSARWLRLEAYRNDRICRRRRYR